MNDFVSALLLILVLFFSCKEKSAFKDKNIKIAKAQDHILKHDRDRIARSFPSSAGLHVSAHLIYNDGSLSTFDVLSDKSKALWNVIAGGGDALKPSERTKISMNGNLDSLEIKIKNGRELAVDTTVMHFDKPLEYIVENTGCAEVYIFVIRNKVVIYNDTIPFHCGE